MNFPEIDENGRINAKELHAWLIAKSDEYHGRGEGMERILNGGRVDALWTVAAELQGEIVL